MKRKSHNFWEEEAKEWTTTGRWISRYKNVNTLFRQQCWCKGIEFRVRKHQHDMSNAFSRYYNEKLESFHHERMAFKQKSWFKRRHITSKIRSNLQLIAKWQRKWLKKVRLKCIPLNGTNYHPIFNFSSWCFCAKQGAKPIIDCIEFPNSRKVDHDDCK